MAESKTPNTSAEQLITEHLDIWTTAIEQKSSSGRGSSKKFSLHGIKKLRELILELAVRGKLVPQDPNDEPALVLLERIAAEKAQLVKDKKIKKPKALPEISEDEKPFELPKGWEWSRLSEIAEIGPRNTEVDDDTDVSFVPMPLITTSYKGSHGSEIRKWKEIKKGYTHFADGDIALAKITPCFENSKAAVFNDLNNGLGAGTTELHVARPIPYTIDPLFILLYLKAPMFLKVGETKMTGSAGQKRVPKDFFANNPLPFAPLEEQHRIVAKVDELMSLCDALEAQTENSITAHQTLVEVLLEALLKAPEQNATPEQATAQFQQNWQRLSEHFDTLFTTTASIDTLKQTILQLAVMGKLVQQNPDDQSVEDTLSNKDIVNRATLKEGKGALLELSRPFQPNDLRYDLPRSWSWIRLGQVMKVTGGSQPPKSKFIYEERDGYVRLVQIRDFKSDDYLTFVPVEYANRPFGENDIMIGRYGPPVFQILKGLSGTYNVALMKADVIGEAFDKNFLFYLLSEPGIQKLVTSESERTAGQSGVRKELIYEFVIGLPPKVEQRKIVTKIEQLMDICDQLKARLTDAQTTKLHLTDAIVEQAL
jgi:type I restriction enzyme S subunit